MANAEILFLVITHRASLLDKIKIAFGRMIQVSECTARTIGIDWIGI